MLFLVYGRIRFSVISLSRSFLLIANNPPVFFSTLYVYYGLALALSLLHLNTFIYSFTLRYVVKFTSSVFTSLGGSSDVTKIIVILSIFLYILK